nr:hypothetical protein [Tanacetum cinerariifolium]
MRFAASIAVKKFGFEAYNRIIWVTEDTKGIFRRYPKEKRTTRLPNVKVVEDNADAEDTEDDYDDNVDVNEEDEAKMLAF